MGYVKIPRVVRSPLAAETTALADALDEGLYIKSLYEKMMGKERGEVDMLAITDSKSLFQTIHKSTTIRDKRCMVDLAVLRQGKEEALFKVAWQKGTLQLADVLTKNGCNSELTREIFASGNCGVEIV